MTGSLGVGNASPQSRLHVGGDSVETITTPWEVVYQHYNTTYGANITRTYLHKSWNGTIGDYLYLGATANASNTGMGAMVLADSGTLIQFGKGSDGADSLSTVFLSFNASGAAKFNGNVGFNGTTAIAKPTITGSRGGNAALASLLTALASYGLITDSTTA